VTRNWHTKYPEAVENDAAPTEFTGLLGRLAAGDQAAGEAVLNVLYDELHLIASRLMSDQRAAHTLQTTALLNEAWMRLAGGTPQPYQGQRHFVRVAARAMRCVLVDHARRRTAKKRRRDRAQPLETDALVHWDEGHTELLALNDALERLGERDEELLRIVELRYFGGLTLEETASMLGMTVRQVHRRWTFARGWLRRTLEAEEYRDG
jgi:RNA polymerase sigma-70 factor (ECF subfamily)